MVPVTRASIRKMMEEILIRQGKKMGEGESSPLDAVGFRSLDSAELALRVESASGRTLEFGADTLRAIRSVRDVLDFLEQAASRNDAG
jgi:acyl carrier protein